MLRKLMLLVCLVAAIPLGLLIWFISVDAWARWKYVHITTLASGGSKGDKESDFQQRIQKAFKSGTPQSDVAAALHAQGFSFGRSWRSDVPSLILEVTIFPCMRHFEVNWSADKDGRLTSIDGYAQDRCM